VNGLICLQGGNEFTPDCREMDEDWLERIDAGVVAVAPLACATGVEYRTAANNGAEYLRDLGVSDIIAVPEPETSLRGSVRAIIDADTVVIPGGSPVRIHQRVVDTAIGGALRAHLVRGGTLIGSSAGAMVLGEAMVVPGDDMQVYPGLAVVPGVLVLPHFGEPRTDVVGEVSAQVGADIAILGIPACCGVLPTDGELVALGALDSWRFTATGEPSVIPHA
jgi:cyanophycinase